MITIHILQCLESDACRDRTFYPKFEIARVNAQKGAER